MGLADVVIGGAITLAGTVVTQVVAWKVSKADRSEKQTTHARESRREDLIAIQDAAAAYRSILTAYSVEISAGEEPGDSLETQLREARIQFEKVVYRCDEQVYQPLERWSDYAQNWANGEAGAERETELWKTAMKTCSKAVKQNR